LLADEPTGNLDIASGKEVMALFQALCHDPENPISILMVTHDPDLASNADRMLLLNNGKTEASDIRSAWGLDAEEAPVAATSEDETVPAPSEDETVTDTAQHDDALEEVDSRTVSDETTDDSHQESGGEEE